MLAEESAPARARFTIHRAIEWFKAPENQPKIEAWIEQAGSRAKQIIFRADEMIGDAAHVIRDALENPETSRALADDLLDSFFGGGKYRR